MSNFTSVNILDMINAIGEEELQLILSDFSCPMNHEIEEFVRKNAIEFAKRKTPVITWICKEMEDLECWKMERQRDLI